MSLLDLASLVLAPTATKEGKVYSAIPDTGDGDMTFTRGSSATRINSAGLIEKERANLLLQSNAFDTTWSNASTTETGGQTDKSGGTDAWKIDLTAAGGWIFQSISTSGVQAFSVYAKAGTLDWVRLYASGSSTSFAYFDLVNGLVGTTSGTIDTNIELISNGYYRIDISFNHSSTTAVRIYPAQADNDLTATSGNILIQDAMLNVGLVAQPYIETTTTAIYEGITDDVPRVDYSGGGCPSLLLESQRTNLVTNSEYLDDWLDAGTTTTLSSIINPSGYAQSYKIAASSSATNALRYDLTFSASTDYSYSVFLKAGTSEEVRMQIYDGNTFQRLAVNPLNNFAVVDQSGINSYSIENYGGGWYRVVMNFTTTASAGSGYLQIYPDRTGNLNNVEAWGAMLEAGGYSTSYIPTYGVSSTRVADSCSKTGISELIGQTEGTLFLDVDTTNFEGDQRFGISDGTSVNRIVLRLSGSIIQFSVVSASTIQASISGSGSSGNRYKMAGVYKENDFALYVNGSLIGTDTSGTISGTFSRIANDNGVGGQNFYNPIKQAILFPTRLTNDQLEELTK